MREGTVWENPRRLADCIIMIAILEAVLLFGKDFKGSGEDDEKLIENRVYSRGSDFCWSSLEER